jgi:tRNA-specific 2-thiouridylase
MDITDRGSRIADCGLPDRPAAETRDANPKSPIRNLQLWEGADKNKDQSYFLALLSQAQLRDALFPIGHLTKPELRALAAEARLPTARKKDSQGICFIGEVKMADFLKAYVPEHPGPIIRATDNKVIGEHRGLHYYTIGQRRGIRIPSNTDHEAYVVVGKRASDHALLVAFDQPDAPGLWAGECRVHSLSFIGQPVTTPRRLECRVRYRDPRVAIDFTPGPDGTAHVKFTQPQRALAPGQIMALHDGEQLLGGAVFA